MFPFVGDCTIVAKVNTLGGSNSSRRAGVMMRQSLDANAMEMGTLVGPTRIYNPYRTSAGGSTSSSQRHRHRPALGAHRAHRQLPARRTVRQRHDVDPVHRTHHHDVRHGLCRSVCLFGDTTTTIGSTFSNVSITGGCPANLAATVGSNTVNLTWTGVTGAASYNVKRATASGGPYTTVGTPTSGLLTPTA